MNPTSALSSLQNSNPLLAILWAGFTCGTLDISAALVVYRYFGRPPMRLLQEIAAGVLGSRSFQGGLPTALLGLFCHFFIRIFCRHRLPYGEPLDTFPSGARRTTAMPGRPIERKMICQGWTAPSSGMIHMAWVEAYATTSPPSR
jgi:hypothetical protein